MTRRLLSTFRALLACFACTSAANAVAQEMTLTAPASTPVGSEIDVTWAGQANEGDFITIVPANAPEGIYRAYAYARENPVRLAIPELPGEYELRYLDATSPYPTRGRAPLTVIDVGATLTAPAEVPAGELFELEWVGPNNALDFIGLAQAGAAEGTYGSYKYASEGSPLTLRAPTVAGEYELRYMLGQAPYRTVGRTRVTVTSTAASVTVPATVETGFAPVGALTAWYGDQYGGSFCTGTLVRADWVLTAAHCLDEASPSSTRFYVGHDANDRTSGTFYPSLEFRIHERYSPRSLANDIALVRLQSPVNGVTPIPYNTASLGPYEGQTVFRLGFGAVEGVEESGKGLKRSSNSSISQIDTETFTSAYNGTGTCFGDSGGPALLSIKDTLSIVGVTIAGAICQEVDCDPCKTTTTSTRVDAYGTWIDATLNEPASQASPD